MINHISSDGKSELLGSINASNSNNYSFETSTYKEGVFELVAVDKNGNEFPLSKIVENCNEEAINLVSYSNNNLNFNIYNEGNSVESMEVYDVSGKLVQLFELQLSNGVNSIKVPFKYSSGVFIVKSLTSEKINQRILL